VRVGRFPQIDLEAEPQPGPAEKLRQAFDLAEAGIRLKRLQLRQRFPAASDEELSNMLTEWLFSDE
jgi:hypothetical protein